MIMTFYNAIICLILAVVGMLVGQINLVCYKVLPCGDDEKEPPVFRKENFKNEFNLLFGLPTMILFPLLFLKYGIALEFFAYSLLSVALVTVVAVDFKHCIIPDKINLFIVITGIIYIIGLFITKQTSVAISHILGGLIGGGIFLALALISLVIYKQEGMGFGDVKLMTGLGLFYGIKGILVLTLVGFALGAVVCIALIVAKIKSMKDYIPFGPFLVIAATLLMFIPSGFFVDWYLNLLK
ncbi:MAG: prepilin peptidase [Clostridiales bacterium]|nr:prepilin peptidase [Clostridiales bacterium]